MSKNAELVPPTPFQHTAVFNGEWRISHIAGHANTFFQKKYIFFRFFNFFKHSAAQSDHSAHQLRSTIQPTITTSQLHHKKNPALVICFFKPLTIFSVKFKAFFTPIFFKKFSFYFFAVLIKTPVPETNLFSVLYVTAIENL